jgi:hypothetical protein
VIHQQRPDSCTCKHFLQETGRTQNVSVGFQHPREQPWSISCQLSYISLELYHQMVAPNISTVPIKLLGVLLWARCHQAYCHPQSHMALISCCCPSRLGCHWCCETSDNCAIYSLQ